MLNLAFDSTRPLDMIFVGRANVDFYTTEAGPSLEDASSFTKEVGGSPANMAVGFSRLGGKGALLTRVSEDPFGRFVFSYLQNTGVDTQFVRFDDDARTSIVFVEVKPHHSDVLFYRSQAADMNLTLEGIDETICRQTKAIMLTGTALSREPSRRTVFQLISLAKQANTPIFFDLDYRASEWSSTDEAGNQYLEVARQSDVVIGTEEEIGVMFRRNGGGLVSFIETLMAASPSLLIQKRGMNGATAYLREQSPIDAPAFKVDAFKPYGAGDAFAASLCYGLLQQHPLLKIMRDASAAAAIVVSRYGCAAAMPTQTEIQDFLHHAQTH